MQILLCIFICLLPLISAWTDFGHVLTAEIASRNLTKAQLDRLNALAGTFNPYFQGRDTTKFPYLATFMDDIKVDTHLFDNMHFIDYPYQPEPLDSDLVVPNPESINGVEAMTEAAKSLIFFPREKDQKVRLWSKAFSLLLFVHVFGDVHQPLHAVTLFNKEFTPPVGDMGGNKWRINYTSEMDGKVYTQMHLLFDCIGGLPCDYMPHPVNATFAKSVQDLADSVTVDYPRESFAEADLRADLTSITGFHNTLSKWTRESFELAKLSYESYKLDQNIDQASIQWARSMLKRQIALAGYRMGYILAEMDTAIYAAPDRNQVPSQWRAICIFAVFVAVLAILLLSLTFRKYKDYKQLASAKASASSTNATYTLLGNND